VRVRHGIGMRHQALFHCAGTTRAGVPCRNLVTQPGGWCGACRGPRARSAAPAPTLPAPSLPPPPSTLPPPSPPRRLPTKFAAKAVGVSFADGYPASLTTLGDTPLEVVREPDNEFDLNAIAIRRTDTGQVIGHVSRNLASRLAPAMDGGQGVIVPEYEVLAWPDKPDQPGLELSVELVEWADPDGPSPRPLPTLYRRNPLEVATEARHRATQANLRSVRIGGEKWAVESASQPGVWHRVVVNETRGVVQYCCDCERAKHAPYPLACVHGATVERARGRTSERAAS